MIALVVKVVAPVPSTEVSDVTDKRFTALAAVADATARLPSVDNAPLPVTLAAAVITIFGVFKVAVVAPVCA